ncbi:5'/3'-nucleotidase SurE [Mesosutterella sp. OilRF-GAM-744-9]|uniref:5'-nucleotidase SurE n=1 Tax=Mesosutterella porci TaxID=2915351 RepID=A0ABS9MT64_9BURK|nr:5'/3'-nucleotidase SurE [Mesosutterella sp. oilRF-744-WT-GAM-9]MCG5031811.1 5'/3'-nucleotidase SurE [Mesosutterella sp. oilRF-744-WT-GAM-9]
MHILISNDDGYSARGIQALAAAMGAFGEVTVCAPEHNQSGASNSLTLQMPLRATEVAHNVFAVSGTPSDCVHLAFTGLLRSKPDLVVSGINSGANMGDDTMYSGTVAAAVEGFQFGVDAIAFSQIDRGWMELESAARVASDIVRQFLERKSSGEPVLLNVNIPNMPYSVLSGVQVTRLGRRHSAGGVFEEIDPRGEKVYWLGRAGDPKDQGPGTDFYATAHGFVSVSPLQIDLTQYSQLSPAATWFDEALPGREGA